MNFDDVFINVPCQLNPGSISVAASQTQVCVGQPVTITASGASTYAWSNGATTAAITVSPNANTTYMVSGTNPLTGCVFTANQMITVNPAPLVGIFVANPSVCKGSSVQMSAFGAQSYNWNNGGNTPNITVSPSASTSYTVVGINSFGCQSSAVQLITVNNLPTIVTAISGNQICLGETAMFSASGGAGNNYVWNSNSSTISGSVVVVSPNVSTSYVVTGTDANGCSNTATVNLSVSACTGVSEITTASGVKVYPNPSKGEFSVVFNNEDAKTVDVMDVTGRLVANMNGTESTLNFNLGTLANGVYYVRIQSNNTTEVVKLIKE